MKSIKFYPLLMMSIFIAHSLSIVAQLVPQNREPNLKGLTVSTRFTTETPEGIIGERKMKMSSNFLFIQGNAPTVYLICHRSQDALDGINTLADAQRRGYGINRTFLINNKWETILPHSSLPKDALSSSYKIEFKGGEQVFYKWMLVPKEGTPKVSGAGSFVMPRPMNVAILGDSYSSGEGAPVATSLWLAGNSGNNCHRSENSGQFQAVKQFATNNPGIAIVYTPFFVSCSGATTIQLISDEYKTDFCNKISGSENEIPQIKQLRNVFDNADKFKEDIKGKIDVLVVSIGGNDAGFADAVVEAFEGNLAKGISFYTKGAREIIPKSYDELRKAIQAECIEYVFASHYPDPTKGDNGITCGLPGNALTFLFNAFVESLRLSVATEVAGICEAENALINFFTAGTTDLGCDNLLAFPTPDYDMVINHLRCNAPLPGAPNVNFTNNDFENTRRIARGFESFIRIISASPDLKRFTQNLLNGCIPADGVPSDLNLFATLLATRDDISAARNGYLLPMDSVISAKGMNFRNAGFTNWHVLDNVLSLSENHGMCRCDGNQRYFNSLFSSYDQQGTKDGTMHMNGIGQLNVYKTALLGKISEVITISERKKMFVNESSCKASAEPYKVSPQYENLLTTRALEKKVRNDRREADFLVLKTLLKPIIDIIDKMNENKFADQYKAQSFKNMREKRLKK